MTYEQTEQDIHEIERRRDEPPDEPHPRYTDDPDPDEEEEETE